MGKANRNKIKRSNNASAKTVKNQKKSGLALTITLAAVALVVVAAVLWGVVSWAITLTDSLTLRKSKAIYTDNYTVNGSALQYMFMADYQEFLNTYMYYTSYIGLDTSLPLAEQDFGSGADSLLGNFDGTWKDYFMSSLKSQTEQMLLYCEVANVKGVELDDADYAAIDEAIHSIEHSAADAGYSLNAYLAASFGNGVRLDDIRSALELSSLAAKVAEVIDAELMDGITVDEINAKYEADKKSYNVKDYIYYTMSVEYEDVLLEVIPDYDGKAELTDEQEAKVLEAYENKVNEAKAKAEAFKNYATVEDFKQAALEDLADLSFDSFYKTEALADADKLSDTALNTVKNAMIAKVIEEVMADAESSDDTTDTDGVFTAYGVTLTENAAKAVDNIKSKLYSNLNSATEAYFSQKIKYDAEDSIPKWAFDEAEGIGDTNSLSFGDGADEGEFKNTNGYFDIAVYMIASEEYCDKTLAKNVGYMTFSDEATAKKAIESFKSSANKDYAAWEAVAKSCSAVSVGKFENYLEGQLSYGNFETWLYDEETAIGSITETPVTNSSTTTVSEYAIFLYYGEGDEAWYIDVKNVIFVDDYQEYYNSITEKYPVTIDEKVIDKIDV